MDNFQGILSHINFAKEINQRLSFTSPVVEIMRDQQRILDNIMPYSNPALEMMSKQQRIFDSIMPAKSILESLNIGSISNYGSVVAALSKPAIWEQIKLPTFATDFLDKISYQDTIFKSAISALGISPAAGIFNQFNTIHSAIQKVTQSITATAILQDKWEILEDYERLYEQVLEQQQEISEQGISANDAFDLFQKLVAQIGEFIDIHKIKGARLYLLLEVLMMFAGVHMYYDFLKTKPAVATQTDVINSTKNLKDFVAAEQQKSIDSTRIWFNKLQNLYQDKKEVCTVKRQCKVLLKPNDNSLVINSLPQNFEVTVVERHSKWVCISFYDPKDELMQCGWVMKKYL